MSDFLDYLDEVYEELVDEFGHEIEANCVHEQISNQPRSIRLSPSRDLVCARTYQGKES